MGLCKQLLKLLNFVNLSEVDIQQKPLSRRYWYVAERKAQLTPYHRLVYLREQGITTFNLFSFNKTVLPWFLVSLVTHLHKKEKNSQKGISKETGHYDKTIGTHEMWNTLEYTTFFFHYLLPPPNSPKLCKHSEHSAAQLRSLIPNWLIWN